MDFGFADISSLKHSLLRLDYGFTITILSAVCAWVANVLGIAPYSLVILMVALMVELLLGILLAVRRGEFQRQKLERFGLKLGAYLLVLIVLNAFKIQYLDDPVELTVYSSLHSFVVFYIIGVYTVSILESVYGLTESEEIKTLLDILKLRFTKRIKKFKDE